jgi:DNA-nicking Smr family endonuclease
MTSRGGSADGSEPAASAASSTLIAARIGSRAGLVSASIHSTVEHQVAGVADRQRTMAVMKLKLDLHDIYNRGGDIDRALRAIIDEAVAKKAPLVEIIPGKGSGALKKHVLRFLDQKEIKALYHRVEKDSNNFGRVFVHFRWK